ncbi:hypothetical protein DBR33_09045 [Stenotrophomonas sp. HMWF022]|nr:hypothetical protein DBR33_09045 [Stenotrophomonas sp. HMWF022]
MDPAAFLQRPLEIDRVYGLVTITLEQEDPFPPHFAIAGRRQRIVPHAPQGHPQSPGQPPVLRSHDLIDLKHQMDLVVQTRPGERLDVGHWPASTVDHLHRQHLGYNDFLGLCHQRLHWSGRHGRCRCRRCSSQIPQRQPPDKQQRS